MEGGAGLGGEQRLMGIPRDYLGVPGVFGGEGLG